MKRKSRTEYSILNITTGVGGYIVNTVVGFVCRMVFVRCLADDYLGINGLFTNILSMLSLAELGIGSAIVYALYKPLAEDDQRKVAMLMRFYGKAYRIIGCVVAAFGLCMLPFLNLIITDPPAISENLYVIYLLFLFNTSSTYFFSYRSSLLMADQKNYIVTGLSYLFSIVQSILQMILLVVTHQYMTYLLVQTIGVFLYNVSVSYIAKKTYPYILSKNVPDLDKEEKGSLIKNVKALTIWKLSGLLVNNTDNIIITYFSGLKTVGYSSNYTLFSGMLASLLNLVFNGLTASIGNLNAKESKEKKVQFLYSLNLINFWVFGLAAIGIFVVSSDLVALFYGQRFVLPNNIPFVIALNFYMVGMQNAVWTYKNTMGLFRQGRYLLLLTAGINLVCSIVLGNIWGLFGILFATAISRALTNTWYDPYAVFRYGLAEPVWPYYKRYIQFAVIEAGCAFLCFELSKLLQFNLFVNIMVKCVICVVLPSVVFFIVFHNWKEFEYCKNLVNRILSKFKRSH